MKMSNVSPVTIEVTSRRIKMKRFKLKPEHPTYQKLQKIFDLAEDLGISIWFHPHGAIITDKDKKFPGDLVLLDIEDTNVADGLFPPTTEWMLVYDNPTKD